MKKLIVFVLVSLMLFVAVSPVSAMPADGNNGACTAGETGCNPYHHWTGPRDDPKNCKNGWFYGRPAGNNEWEEGLCAVQHIPTNVPPTIVPPTTAPSQVPTNVPTKVSTLPPTAVPTQISTIVPSTPVPTNEPPTKVPTIVAVTNTAMPTATLVSTSTTVPTASPTQYPTFVPSATATLVGLENPPVTGGDGYDWSGFLLGMFGDTSCGTVGWIWYVCPLFLLILGALIGFAIGRAGRKNKEQPAS